VAKFKITELTNLTNPSTTDVMPVVDVDADVTKKVSVGEVVGKITGDVEVATDGTATISELPVSKLADGSARQLLQTDAAGTGVEWTSNVDVPGTLDVTGAAVFDSTGRFIGDVTLDSTLIFEGSTADGFETTLTVVDPTADRTITLPDVTGTVMTTGDTGTVTSTMILDGTIVNVDINASAAIAGTKIDPDFGSQTVETTGVFSAAGGAEATPSITFTGDLDTGIYSPSADRLSLATNGTGRLFVGSTGTIQTQSTGQIESTSSAGSLTLYGGSTNKGGGIQLNGGNVDGNIIFYAQQFTATPAERARITSDGKLGLGISSPSSLLHLADAGDITVGTTTGTKIGTATSQKIGFYNATPVVQPTTGVAEAAFVENSGGTAVNVDSTFGGYTIQQVVEALQTLGLLA
jgi:hypothetical protein